MTIASNGSLGFDIFKQSIWIILLWIGCCESQNAKIKHKLWISVWNLNVHLFLVTFSFFLCHCRLGIGKQDTHFILLDWELMHFWFCTFIMSRF